jgi:hypothetical protein
MKGNKKGKNEGDGNKPEKQSRKKHRLKAKKWEDRRA